MQDATVLEYAPRHEGRSPWRTVWLAALRGLLILMGMAIGAGLGHASTPVKYRAEALYSLPFPFTAGFAFRQFPAAEQFDSQLRSPVVLDAVLADLRSKGHATPSGAEGHAFLQGRLDVGALVNSRFVQVRFEADRPQLASDAANAFARAATSLPMTGGRPTLFAAPATSARRSGLGTLLGVLCGVCVSAILVARHVSADRRRGIAATSS